jgi:N-acetylglucosamine repressor
MIHGRNAVDIHRHNMSAVLKIIMQNPSISRHLLAEATGLTKTTVSGLVNKLIENGLILEKGEGLASKKGGRKPICLKIISDSVVAIGIDIRREKVAAVLLNLKGAVLARSYHMLSDKRSSELILKSIYDCIHRVSSKRPKDSILIGIGVGAAGPLDLSEGAVLAPLDFGAWCNVKLKQKLMDKYHTAIVVETGAVAGAYSEYYWRGSTDNRLDFIIFIEVDSGLGFCMLINGKIVRGNSSAGEIGHMVVDIHGEPCECGRKGCLDLHASGMAILKKLGLVTVMTSEANLGLLLEEVVKKAQNGDAECLAVIRNAAEYLGIGIVNLFNLLSPKLVVLGSSMPGLVDLYMDTLQAYLAGVETLEKNIIPRLTKTTYGLDAIAVGAATIMLNEFYEDPLLYLNGKH